MNSVAEGTVSTGVVITWGPRRRTVSRIAAGLAASTLVVAACTSGSADVDEAAPAAPDASVAVDEPPTAPATASPSSSTDVVTAVVTNEKAIVTRAANATETVLPEGVDAVMARVTSADGDVCEVCLWLADDDALRQRGLMGVTDLGEAVGMAFRWEQPQTGNFFMFQTPTPLSIAWFDTDDAHVGQADMEPCLVDDSATCERYTADSPYVLAVEMFGGQLDAIGIGPGAGIELLDVPCA